MSMVFLILLAIMWLCEVAMVVTVLRGDYADVGLIGLFILFLLAAGACYLSLSSIRETRRETLKAERGGSSRLIKYAVKASVVFLMMLYILAFSIDIY